MDRDRHLARLASEEFDLLIVGGGATGTGIALDAVTRGLKVALVERDDFASGTSSRSTKLIHGGVRYLEQAFKTFDRSQLNLVRDALKERSTLLKIAPHLAHPLPIVTPIYSWFGVPYFTIGLKMYDFLAGQANLAPSQYIPPKQALEKFPMLRAEGLRGAVVYYDGQFNDARMNVAIAQTAAEEGAAIANHVAVTALKKDAAGKVGGATVRDTLNDKTWEINAKVVINATGPFTDNLRRMDDPNTSPMLKVSSGIHIVLDAKFSPPATGMLIPKTEDGRLLFLLPWLGHTLVGTTDNVAGLEANPKATEEDIEYVLRHVREYFALPVTRQDVKATWAGLRPLVFDPKASDTAKLSRDHVVNISDSGLLTISGGKWTTYRKMSLDAVDQAIALGNLQPTHAGPQTENLKLVGSKNYVADGVSKWVHNYGISEVVAAHLHRSYGARTPEVMAIAKEGYDSPLAAGHPHLEAEVIYGARHEGACTAVDILARRTRLGFLDSAAANGAIDRVVELLSNELGWTASQRDLHHKNAVNYFANSV
ncbi:MAG: FAD-dependent oxidoreductase [Cyanobacteria bacterium P01_D01_bin.73]